MFVPVTQFGFVIITPPNWLHIIIIILVLVVVVVVALLPLVLITSQGLLFSEATEPNLSPNVVGKGPSIRRPSVRHFAQLLLNVSRTANRGVSIINTDTELIQN
jgi:hypothetical protein